MRKASGQTNKPKDMTSAFIAWSKKAIEVRLNGWVAIVVFGMVVAACYIAHLLMA